MTTRSIPTTQACIYGGNTVRSAQLLKSEDSVDAQVKSQRNGNGVKGTAVVFLTKQVNQHGQQHQKSDF